MHAFAYRSQTAKMTNCPTMWKSGAQNAYTRAQNDVTRAQNDLTQNDSMMEQNSEFIFTWMNSGTQGLTKSLITSLGR